MKNPLHSLSVLLLAAVSAAAIAAPAAAVSHSAAPDAAPPPVAPLDVSAIAIMPFDLPAEPWAANVGFFFEPGGNRVAEYWTDMAIVDATGETMLRKVVSEVRQLADTASAQAQFQTWAGHAAEYSQIAAAAPMVGEQSVVSTSSGENNSAEVVLRVGTVVARITLLDFTGGSPTPDQVVALGQIAAGRTATGQGGGLPALGNRILLLAPTDQFATPDERASYWQIDGVPVRGVGETEESLQQQAAHAATNLIDDVFNVNQEFEHVSGDPGQHLSYQARIFSFPTDAAAAAFVSTAQAEFQTNAYYTNIAPITPSGLPGAAAVSYDFPRGDGLIASGHRLWAQIGTFVVMIEADRVGGAPLQGITELAVAQISCVQAGSCPQLAVPASLLSA